MPAASSFGEKDREVWRLIPLQVGDTSDHMARTDLLVRSAKSDGSVVWWHSSDKRSLVVGPSLKSRIEQSDSKIPVFVRPSGGGAVLAGPGLLGLDVALPAHHNFLTGDVIDDYEWFAQVWRDALCCLGIEASCLTVTQARDMSKESDPYPENKLACFATVSPYEIMVEGKKVVGLSQVRRGGGVLLAAAIHINLPPAEIAQFLPLSLYERHRLAAHLARRAASISEFLLTPPTVEQVMEAFHKALCNLYPVLLVNRIPGRDQEDFPLTS